MENVSNMVPLADLASEYWKLLRAYERLIHESSPEKVNRLKSNYRNSERKLGVILEEQKLKIISYEERDYTPNLAVNVINVDEFENNEGLVIAQMLEPTVMHKEQVLKTGKAILKEKGEE